MKFATLGVFFATIAVFVLLSGATKNIAFAAVSAPSLGSTTTFAVLGASSVVDSNVSVIVGDVGVSPASGSFDGITCPEVTGNIYGTDSASPALCALVNPTLLTKATTDFTTAYTILANETPATTLPGSDNQLGSQTLTPGIYTFSAASSANIVGTVTLDGQGDSNAVFVFQTSSSLVTGSGSVVHLINSAQPCNVFWQVGSSATLGTGTTFVGTIMANQSITDSGGSTVAGRLLVHSAAVTLNNTHVTVPSCSAPTTGTLHVIKSVINTHAGSAVPSDFQISVKTGGSNVSGSPAAGAVSPGTLYTLAPATYTISENANSLYTQSFGGACTAGSVALSAGQNLTCTIINTDLPPPPPISMAGAGGTVPPPIVPLIGIIKVPTPLALPAGPGQVVYHYTVTDLGATQALTGVRVVDDHCSPLSLISGDTNDDGILDPGEHWQYSCSARVATTTTNTAVATAFSNDAYRQPAVATAIATVVVGAPVPPPLIAVVKVPSQLTPFPYGGGNVTYAYTVTNPGVVAMNNISVTDDKCGPVKFVSGDINSNHLLDPGESWIYRCSANVPISTRNTATALGSANGFTAVAYAFATVLVSAPATSTTPILPNTGLPPSGENAFWNLVSAVLMLALVLSVSIIVLKKRSTVE